MLEEMVVEFWSKVEKQQFCWIWKAHKDYKGYGLFLVNSLKRAHRIAYTLVKGPIPEGMVIDHLCENKSCVNPDHLEAVTSRINSLRARNTLVYINSMKRYCPKGHPYFGSNLYISKNGYNGARRCKTCKNEQERIRDRAKRPWPKKQKHTKKEIERIKAVCDEIGIQKGCNQEKINFRTYKKRLLEYNIT